MSDKTSYHFTVYGIPKPGGSKRAFVNPKTGRAIITEDCKTNRQWRDSVIAAAVDACDRGMLTGPLSLYIAFYLPRPKGHYGTGKNAGELKENAPTWCDKRPDATKLLRSTEDALTKILWHDDSQIVRQTVLKIYAGPEPPRAFIVVAHIDNGPAHA